MPESSFPVSSQCILFGYVELSFAREFAREYLENEPTMF